MDQQKIGYFLRDLRKEKDLTQEQLAEQFGVSGRTISRWETGKSMPDISLLSDIASFYDVSIPEIIDGERKSEIMNEDNKEETKEVADKMSDYAGAEKETILKNVRNLSIVGACAGLAALITELIFESGGYVVTEYIHLYCETLVYVTVFFIALHSSGLLYKYKVKDRESSKIPAPLQKVLAAVIAIVVAVAIKYLLSAVFG